jgi:predicted site-specific integrase-resolvase
VGKVVELKRLKDRERLLIGDVAYIDVNEFANRVGIVKNTVYQWKAEGRLEGISRRYMNKLLFEEKAVEPFKKTLLRKA